MNKGYEIRVLKSKKDAKHDVTKAQVALKPDSNGNKGQYYHISVMTGKQNINGVLTRPQVRPISFPVFENGTRAILFQDIKEAIEKGEGADKGYTKSGDDILLNPKEQGLSGDIHAERTPFTYETEINGRKTQRNSIQVFVCEGESADVLLAAEFNRARRSAVQVEGEGASV